MTLRQLGILRAKDVPPVDVDARRAAPAPGAVRREGRRRDRPGAHGRGRGRRPARPRRRVARRRLPPMRPRNGVGMTAPATTPGLSAPTTTCTRRWPGGCRRRRGRRRASPRSSSRCGGGSTSPSTSSCVRWSALLGAVEALEAGTTAIVDHHASPAAIDGSLDVIAEACAEVGVRVRVRLRGHRPPRARRRRGRAWPRTSGSCKAGGRGLVGAHACLHPGRRDARRRRRAGRRPRRRRAHPRGRGRRSTPAPRERLRPLATDDWLLAHCVHVDRRCPARSPTTPGRT